MVGGGLGIAPIYPVARALKKKKNRIIVIIGAKSKNYLFWEDKFKKTSDQLIICTDDGSKGKKGFVTQALKELMENKIATLQKEIDVLKDCRRSEQQLHLSRLYKELDEAKKLINKIEEGCPQEE